jgi:hypothetical protein
MKVLQRVCLAALTTSGLALADTAIPMFADVRIKERLTFKDSKTSHEMNRTIEIKGLQMRIEDESSGTVMIYSVEAGKRFRFDAPKKEVFVLDLLSASKHMEDSVEQKKLSRELRPSGKKSKVVGQDCDEYTFELQAPYLSGRAPVTHLWDRGTVCVSTTAAGSDFSNFIREAMKRGYARAVLPISPSLSPIGPYFFGQDMNLFVLGARTESSFKSDKIPPPTIPAVERKAIITEIRSDMIPDEEFQIPVGWKLRKDKDQD